MEKDLEKLWSDIEALDSISDRIILIHNDTCKKRKKYKKLAGNDPYRLFLLLGGDESNLSRINWAYEYTYEEYIEDNEFEYNSKKAKEWNIEKESIKRAHDLGYYYVTGICTIQGPNDIELDFEFEYCEGDIGGVIGTPYDKEKNRKHGIEFF